MADMTQAQAQQGLDEALAAHTAVMQGQTFSYGGRTVSRANLREIREDIDYWRKTLRELSGSNSPVIRQICPRD